MVLEKTEFFRAVTDVKTLPQSVAEVIFSGRSNVGKSSVINALCGRKNLARTSKTPGRTRSVNVYSVVMRKWIIDLPGYGFARVSPAEKELWKQMIEECIIERESKKTVYIIIDALVGPTELDLNMADWLKDYNVDYKIVANKCDKISQPDLNEIIKKTAEIFEVGQNFVFAVSAKKNTGIDKFRADIVKFLK
ncbi:ribosome biogenesis GTP-binding protein YihA/YsxC [Endomicrobium proavitum]|uniref:Probable GTP-binding protein EngB n=1 Tax=Endomicrobium proavitum TaxID=1408281 RepID=A0A0G3WK86_9BACT|nr:ribosome biogenesis GTP-binding protein YihA/YsxC [Endomicrobium proavitum]AKL98292.1 putative GTP-binding protein EngB [Endomicrobium proavitum]